MTTKTLPAIAYAKKLAKQEYGPCTIIRAVTQRYPKMARREVLAVADALAINRGTASRQFQEVHSGATRVTGV